MPELETLSADDVRRLLEERDQLRAEVAKLSATTTLSEASLELLKDAACRALEFITAPNPYSKAETQRERTILHLEDALGVNGLSIARFDVRSDAN
jgi:hypothetical protein